MQCVNDTPHSRHSRRQVARKRQDRFSIPGPILHTGSYTLFNIMEVDPKHGVIYIETSARHVPRSWYTLVSSDWTHLNAAAPAAYARPKIQHNTKTNSIQVILYITMQVGSEPKVVYTAHNERRCQFF